RRISRRDGRFRADVVVSEAAAETTSADRPRWQRAQDPRPGRALRRRLDAEPRRGRGADPRAAAEGEGRRPGPRPGDLLPQAERGGDRAARKGGRRPAHLVRASGRPRRGFEKARPAGDADPALLAGLSARLITLKPASDLRAGSSGSTPTSRPA